ncbi:hypothetical protein V2I52_19730 [Brenneria sp. g21c3]|uniref:hypothetical protein n=1 Tax=Brenneria sp. g21c3 TaxID=3093893 RepID=UPI002EB9F769|nr:hypothetical protein [Brenneria sp. g21c3]
MGFPVLNVLSLAAGIIIGFALAELVSRCKGMTYRFGVIYAFVFFATSIVLSFFIFLFLDSALSSPYRYIPLNYIPLASALFYGLVVLMIAVFYSLIKRSTAKKTFIRCALCFYIPAFFIVLAI